MTNEYREAAYRLLVLSALYQDEYGKAEHYAEKLLDLNPFYTTQVGETPRFADLINRLKQNIGNTVFTASQMEETLEEAPSAQSYPLRIQTGSPFFTLGVGIRISIVLPG